MNPVLSINTLAYEGYDLSTALQEIAKIGVRHVELGYTQGWTEDLTEEHFSEASAAFSDQHEPQSILRLCKKLFSRIKRYKNRWLELTYLNRII